MTGLPRAVIWDLDGTLIDSAPDLAAVLNGLLRDHDLATHSLGQVKAMIGGGIPRLVERGWAASGEILTADELGRLSGRFIERYAAAASDRTRLYPAVTEVLGELRRRGVAQAVCTNKLAAIARQILVDLRVADHFVVVVGGDSTAEKKPHPLPLRICLDAFAFAPEEVVMVGDTAIDRDAGHAAGLPVVLLRSGYSRAPVDGLGADAVVNGVSDLLDALAGLGRWA